MGILDGLGNAAAQAGGFFKGAGEVLWETGEGVVTLGGNALKAGYDLSPAGYAVDGVAGLYARATGDTLEAPDWLPSAARGGERMEAAAEVVVTLARNPELLVDAAVDPIQADWQAGRMKLPDADDLEFIPLPDEPAKAQAAPKPTDPV